MEIDGSTEDWQPYLHMTITPGVSTGITRMSWNGSNRLATCGRERMVYIHDFDDSLNVNFPVQGKDISELRFAKEDLLVVATLSGEISAFKLHRAFRRGANPVVFNRHLHAHQSPVFALDVNPRGAHFISAGADKVIKMWNICGQKLLGQFRKHTNAVRQLAYSWEGSQFLSAGDDREIIEWDARSQNPIAAGFATNGGGASAISYLPGGHVLVGHRDNSLRVYDARTKKAICCYQLYENPIKDLSVHSSGQFAATCSENDQCSTVIDLVNGITLTTFTMKTAVKSAAFLTPCQPPANEFDTSDYLCLPGRNRKLNIFNTCLTKLLDNEDRKSSMDLSEDAKENENQYSQGLAETIENANRKDNPEASQGASQRSQKRMTMARKSIMPKSISVDVIQEEEADENEKPSLKSQVLSADCSMTKLISLVTNMSDRLDDFEKQLNTKINDIENRLTQLEKSGERGLDRKMVKIDFSKNSAR